MERSVAIVGSRAATAYGSGIATDLAADLVEQGVTVLSGGAFGIDVAAHRGALAGGGPTVCVLASGVDVAYPPGHASIFASLARDQLLVSELPPSAHPTRVRFLARNRLIAAMSRGTVVVEAALRSGARNTAGWALGCGRPLMAVPGPVYSRASTTPRAPNRQAGRPTIRIRPTQRLRLSQVEVASFHSALMRVSTDFGEAARFGVGVRMLPAEVGDAEDGVQQELGVRGEDLARLRLGPPRSVVGFVV